MLNLNLYLEESIKEKVQNIQSKDVLAKNAKICNIFPLLLEFFLFCNIFK